MIKKILLAVVIYLVFMLVLFPARVAIDYAPLPKNIKISGVSGSIWQGKAELLTIDGRLLEQVQWQLKPWALLTASLDLSLTIGSRGTPVNGKAEISYGLNGDINLSDLRFNAPSSFLLGKQRLPFNTKAQGDLELMLSEFSWQAATEQPMLCQQLSGKAFLNQLDVNNQFGKYPLGNLVLNLSCDQGAIVATTDEQSNQLGLSGRVLVQADMKLLVAATMKPTSETPQDLVNALSFLGKPDADGSYPLNYNGKIPGL